MKNFDIHVHYLFPIPLDETVCIFQKEFAVTDTFAANFLSIPLEYEDDGSKKADPLQNIKGLFLKKVFSPNAYAFAGLMHPESYENVSEVAASFLQQAKIAMASGFDGFKMIEGYPTFVKYTKQGLDSPIYDAFYTYMEENHFPILMHMANPDENWDISKASKDAIELGRVYDASYPKKEEITSQMFHVLEKHPDLHLILAHFGFFSLHQDDAVRFLSYPHTMLDLTPGGEQLLHMRENWTEKWLPFFTRYQNRILYGTDYYAFPDNDWQYIAFTIRPFFLRDFFETEGEHTYFEDRYQGVLLDKDILEKIYSLNGFSYLGKPHLIDQTYFKKESARLKAHDSLSREDLYDLEVIRNKMAG